MICCFVFYLLLGASLPNYITTKLKYCPPIIYFVFPSRWAFLHGFSTVLPLVSGGTIRIRGIGFVTLIRSCILSLSF